MVQKNFFITKNIISVGKEFGELFSMLKNVPHRDALLTIYETGFTGKQIKLIIDKIRYHAGEKLKIAEKAG